MRVVLCLLLTLTTSSGAFAGAPEPEFVDPHSIEDEVLSQFVILVRPADHVASPYIDDLRGRLRDELSRRATAEKSRARAYPLQPWRTTLVDRVEDLADQMVEVVLAEPTPARHDRAVEVLADLALALAKNAGSRGSLSIPLGGLTGGVLGAVVGVSTWHAELGAMILGTLTGAASGMTAAAFHRENFRPPNHDDKIEVAHAMADHFWREVGARWMTSGKADPALAHASLDDVTARITEDLRLAGEPFNEACERYLGRTAAQP